MDSQTKSPASIVSQQINPYAGTYVWADPTNAEASDGTYATVTPGESGGVTESLKATNFGFTIPENATIYGIKVEVECKYTGSGSPSNFWVNIIKGGAMKLEEVIRPLITTVEDYRDAGDETELWKQEWTSDDINASDFGTTVGDQYVTIADISYFIDHIQITVYYMEVTVTSVQAKASIILEKTTSISAKANIKQTTSGEITVKASIKVLEVSSTISAKASLAFERTKIIEAKANIVGVVLNSITAKANIHNTTVQSVTSKASILRTVATSISTKASLAFERTKIIEAKANIVGVVLKSITAKASLYNIRVQSITGKASIKIFGASTSISAKAELIIERLKNAQAKARIIKQSNIKKSLIYKLYQPDGTFIKTLNQEDILSSFQVNKNINGGVGNLRVTLNKPIDNYDEYDAVKNPTGSIKYGNRIKVFLTDRYNTDKIVFFGYLVAIGPQYSNGQEKVELSFYSSVSKLSNDYYNTSGAPPYEPTEPAGFYVAETAVSASTIIKNILDNFILQTSNPMVSYTWAGSIVDCANTITYTFDRVKHLESLMKIEEYLPATWYWYVDAEGVMYVRDSSVQTEHKLIIGKDIRTIQAHKNIESVINYFLLWNGRSTADAAYVFRDKTDATSKANYDRITLFQQDSKVLSNSVADIRKDKVIAFRKDPKQELTIEVTNEYDIASLEPGQRVSIRNIRSSNQTTFSDGLVIRRISYRVDSALVELAEIGADFVKATSAEETAINMSLTANESAIEDLQSGSTPITDVNIWSGGNQFIEDTVVYSPIIAGVNGYFKESIRMGDDGVGSVIRSYGKSAFNNSVAGFWLEKNTSNDVKFELYKDANNYFRVDLGVGTFSMAGTMIIQSGSSGVANLSDAGSIALLDAIGAANCNTTIISGGKIITGLLTASNIQAGTLSSILIQTSTSANTGVKMSSSLGGIDIYGESLEFKDTSGTLKGSIYGLGGLILKASSGNNINYQGTEHLFNNNVVPNTNNGASLGTASNQWLNLKSRYLQTERSITLASTASPLTDNGTIYFNGSHFYGRISGSWVQLDN